MKLASSTCWDRRSRSSCRWCRRRRSSSPVYYTNGESRIANLMNHQYRVGRHAELEQRQTPDSDRIRCGLFLVGRLRHGVWQRVSRWPLPDQFQVCEHPDRDAADLQPRSAASGIAGEGAAAGQRFTQSFGDATYNEKETLLGLFVQDNWRVTPKLVLNLGLRYDLQTLTQGDTNFSPRVRIRLYLVRRRQAYRDPWRLWHVLHRAAGEPGRQLQHQRPAGRIYLYRAAGAVWIPDYLQPHHQHSPGDGAAGARHLRYLQDSATI